MDERRAQHRQRLRALRDLLLISLAVVGLLWLGGETDVYRGIARKLARRFPAADELVVGLSLASVGLLFFAIRLWGAGRREAAGRAEAESRFRTLVEEMPAATFTWDPRRSAGSRVPTYVSPQVGSLFGVAPEEWRSNPRAWTERIHPDDRPEVLRAYLHAPRDGGSGNIEYRYRHPDGRVVWVREESSVVERDAAGRPTLVQALLFDITERRRAEDQLAEAEARYRTLVERVPAVTYIWNSSFHADEAPAAYVSPQIEFLLGYSPAEFRDPGLWRRLVHPDDLDRVLTEWAACQDGEVPFRSEYRMLARDDRVVWVRDEAVLVARDEQGRPLFQGVMFDITDRKLADERVRAAESRYRSLVENMPAVTYLADYLNDPPERYVAPGIERLLGYSVAEWLGEPGIWRSLIHPDDRERVLAEVERTDVTGDPFSMEYRMLSKDGRVVWVRDDAVIVERGPTPARSVWQGVFVDITRQKEAESRLARAEETYRTLVEQLPVVVYQDAVDDTSTALYLSPGYERMFGYRLEERLRDPNFWIDHLHPDDRDRVVAESRRTNETGDPFVAEYRFIAKDGRVVWVRDEAVLIEGERGPLWQGILMDVTERKLAEETLSRRDAVLRAVGFAAESFLETDDWEQSLPEVLEHLGTSAGVSRVYVFENEGPEGGAVAMRLRAEWLADGIPSLREARKDVRLAYGGAFERWREALAAGREIRGLIRDLPPAERSVLEAEGVVSHVVVPVSVDGDWWGFLGFDDCVSEREWPVPEIEALKAAAETLGAAIGRAREVAARQEAERQVREAEERYRTLVENLPAVAYIDDVDEATSSIYVSPQVRAVFGYTPEEWAALADREAIHPDDLERVRNAVARHNGEGEPFDMEYRLRTKDGRWRWVSDRASVVRDAGGRIAFSQGVVFDITERKLAEEALQQSERREREAAERLRALDDMKNRFLAAVSHELRSPLTSILGVAITLEQQDLPSEDRRDLTRRLAANARKLDRLLKDLLDIDRLSRGIVSPAVRPTEIGELVRRTVESLDGLGDRVVRVETETVVVPVEPAKIERIVENLVMNAIRHTEPEVSVWVRARPEDGGVVIAVDDDGPGVPPELRDAIFEPFRQGPTASPHSPGTGIGLSLVAMFADLHGGRAWVEDREGGGASFRVFLPGHAGNGHLAPAGLDRAGAG